MRILLVEDEAAISDFVSRGLNAEGYAVNCAANGEQGRSRAVAEDFDLVILDRMLPGLDGLDVLDAIRQAKPTLPVIMLTARSEVKDRVEGLDRGATDYLTKPFSFEELAARVRAHLRFPDQAEATRLEAAGIIVELLSREVWRSGHEIMLSPREFDLLVCFMRRPDQVLSSTQLLSTVWGYSHDPGTNVVAVNISQLRRKLSLPGLPAPIKTVRSVGYRLSTRVL